MMRIKMRMKMLPFRELLSKGCLRKTRAGLERLSSSSTSSSSTGEVVAATEGQKEPLVPLEGGQVRTVNFPEALDLKPSQEWVLIRGWIKSLRMHKGITFLGINDGSTRHRLQVVLPKELVERQDLELSAGSSVSCLGQITASPGPKQSKELLCHSLRVDCECPQEEFPFPYKSQSTSKWNRMRLFPHLRARVDKYASLLRVRSETMNLVHQYMQQEKFLNITTPVITTNDCEGAGDMFLVKAQHCTDQEPYFERETYLTVSGQLHLEAMACALSRVYTMGPAFRAENSRSRRHLSEFMMIEAEESFIDTVDGLVDRVEHFCQSLSRRVLSECKDDIDFLVDENEYKSLHRMVETKKYIRLTYDEAVDLINKSQKNDELEYGKDLGAYHEKVLLDYFENIPVFVTHWPSHLKPFYMKSYEGKALCFDLLAPLGGEIAGGSLREDDYDILKHRMEKMKNRDSLEWYLDLRRFGSIPHAGFGMGLERYIQTMTGLFNAKDAVPFPRWTHHCLL